MKNKLHINIFDYELIKVDDVYGLKNISYSLYAILSVDRMYFKKPTSSQDHINIKFKDIYNKHKCVISVYPEEEEQELCIDSNYPFDSLIINKGRIIASDIYVFNKKFERDFKIEYIGISEKKLVCDRLSKHSTLQEIMAFNMANHTNKDLYLLLFNARHFDWRTYGSNDLIGKKKNISDSEIQEFVDTFGMYFSQTDKVVALLEAILINLFKPKYNIEYKNSDPDKMFKTLRNVYDYKFDECTILVSLKENDRENKIKLYTDAFKIELSRENRYMAEMECPFRLQKEEKNKISNVILL